MVTPSGEPRSAERAEQNLSWRTATTWLPRASLFAARNTCPWEDPAHLLGRLGRGPARAGRGEELGRAGVGYGRQ